jgi:porin
MPSPPCYRRPPHRHHRIIPAVLAGLCLSSVPALARVVIPNQGSDAFVPAPTGVPGETSSFVVPGPADTSMAGAGFWDGFYQRNLLLGDMGGLRTALAGYGMTLGLAEVSEVAGNVTGGVHRGVAYDGLTEASLGLDTQRAFGFYGGTFNISALQYHGRSLSADNLLTLQTSSGIQADRATRLWELWYQQRLLNDKVDIKIGEQSLDQEFIVSQNAGLFMNTMFGWPLVPSADLPGGGPAYPLAALGGRVRAALTPNITVLAGVFNGSPTARFNSGDAQQRNASGTSFPLNGGELVFGEVQYSFPGNGGMVYPGGSEPLPGTYKLGFWYDSEPFSDLLYDTDHVSLASPNSNGNPLQRRGNYSIYAVADQTVWKISESGVRALSAFARVMGAPQDRNLISLSVNAGLVLREPIEHRDEDSVGIAMGYGRISKNASDFDKQSQALNGGFRRTGETFIEVTYQAQVTNWMQLQPDVQYVFNPGAGIANPNDVTEKVRNELVLGVRTNITF